MQTIEVLEADDVIKPGDWVKSSADLDWARVEDRVPFWIGKELGHLNDALSPFEVSNVVIRCSKLPFAVPVQ